MRPLEGCGHWNQPAAECEGLRSDLSYVLMVTRCCRSSWWAWRSYFRRTNSPLQQHPARAPLVAKKISPEDFPNNKTASAVAVFLKLLLVLLFCPIVDYWSRRNCNCSCRLRRVTPSYQTHLTVSAPAVTRLARSKT
ncbi:uncharacterized protein LOC119769480 [Culex quinquefasciatus]|uniref:uncharacterized protein LOC119769480 n=1 Tax=Culex quinquefasciatus TaxID=7176 RepID=UPI0018E35CF1|nr:uncharacterized protein LOC119769480 [Culex quinquefasciatus]